MTTEDEKEVEQLIERFTSIYRGLEERTRALESALVKCRRGDEALARRDIESETPAAKARLAQKYDVLKRKFELVTKSEGLLKATKKWLEEIQQPPKTDL